MRAIDDWHDQVAAALYFVVENPECEVESFVHACSVMNGADYLQLDEELYISRVVKFFLSPPKKIVTSSHTDEVIPHIDARHAGDLIWARMKCRKATATMLRLHATRRVCVAFNGSLVLTEEDHVDDPVTQRMLNAAAPYLSKNSPITELEGKGWWPKVLDLTFCAQSLTKLKVIGEFNLEQMGIEKCTKLTDLNVFGNAQVSSVAFCADTLTVLNAGFELCGIRQEEIEHATRLTDLRLANNPHIVSLEFCAKTLRKLDINKMEDEYVDGGITQEGISVAVNLTHLNVLDNPNIVNVDFCADTLTVLNCAADSGITQEGISKATKLTDLTLWYNKTVVDVGFCSGSLTRLMANEDGTSLGQQGIEKAVNLTELDISCNPAVVSVAFCRESLTKLVAFHSGITQEGISKATKLTDLDVSSNPKVVSVNFCAATLTKLEASRECVTQEGVSKAVNLTYLCAMDNVNIVSVDFCAKTLRHLTTMGSGITPEGISKATNLTDLTVDNAEVFNACMKHCAGTLARLSVHGSSCGIDQKLISKAVKLTELDVFMIPHIHNVDFCANTLTNLNAEWKGGVTAKGISKALNLTALDVLE